MRLPLVEDPVGLAVQNLKTQSAPRNAAEDADRGETKPSAEAPSEELRRRRFGQLLNFGVEWSRIKGGRAFYCCFAFSQE